MNDLTEMETQSPAEELDLYEDRRFELIDGERVERATGAKAARISTRLLRKLVRHAETTEAGLVFSSRCGYRIFPHAPRLVRYPNASFVRRGRLPNDEPPDGHMLIIPDLAVEVVSPNDLAEEVEKRVMDYVRVQVPLVWVIFPNTGCARVLRAGGTASLLGEADELRGENVLPGFSCRLAEIFGKK